MLDLYRRYEQPNFRVYENKCNESRFKITVQLIDRWVDEGCKILSVGAGLGPFKECIESRNGYYVGVDWMYNKPHPKEGNWVRACWDYLPFKSKSFDVCLWTESIEHALDPITSLREIGRVGNILILSCPNGEAHFSNLHLRFFNVTTLKEVLRESGMEVIDVFVPKDDPTWIMAVCNSTWGYEMSG